MLANNEEEMVVFLVLFGCVFALVLLALRHGNAERMQRLRVLEQALRDPHLDAVTRQNLVRSLEAPRHLAGSWREWLSQNLAPRRLFTSVAWMTTIIGVMVAALGGRYDFMPGVVMASLGIAVLALPTVLREVEGRAMRR